MFTIQQPRSTVHPYENTKLETNHLTSYSSTTLINMHPNIDATTAGTAKKTQVILIEPPANNIGASKIDKEGDLVGTSSSSGSLEHESRVVIDDLQKRKEPYPQKPAAIKFSSRNLDYGFMKFEPINLDLMLPSTSELLTNARKKNH
jgi:hypothetical protein